jgi:WD40 repeat protein
MATGSSSGYARVFEVSTGREVSRILHQAKVSAVAFSPNGKLVATGSWDNTVWVFEAATGREVRRIVVANYGVESNYVLEVAFSPDSRLIATHCMDRTTRVFEVATGREMWHVLFSGIPWAIAFSPNGVLLATGSLDYPPQVFDIATGRRVARFPSEVFAAVVAFSPNGKLLATGTLDQTARVFEITTGCEVERLAHNDWVFGVAFSHDGDFLATQTGDWLHAYRRDGERWRHAGSRYVPSIWPKTLRSSPQGNCPRCVEFVRDVPEDPLKLERINLDDHSKPIRRDSHDLVGKWSTKLGLTFDTRGRITPLQVGAIPFASLKKEK